MPESDRQSEREWHHSRALQITHLLATLSIGVTAITYVFDIRKDVELLKADRVVQVERDARQDAATSDIKRESREQLKEIGDKLDKLIDWLRPLRKP